MKIFKFSLDLQQFSWDFWEVWAACYGFEILKAHLGFKADAVEHVKYYIRMSCIIIKYSWKISFMLHKAPEN